MTKAQRLLALAYQTYERGEPSISQDICLLAFADASAGRLFRDTAKTRKDRIATAIAEDRYEDAADLMLEEDEPEMDGFEPEAMPTPEMAPAQLASLVTLARKIKQEGHADLAGRITKALGL